jgi:hypothetical protein
MLPYLPNPLSPLHGERGGKNSEIDDQWPKSGSLNRIFRQALRQYGKDKDFLNPV